MANAGVAALLAAASATIVAHGTLLWFAAAAALVTATADTVASEIGQLLGRRAFLPLTFRRVPPGTEGAISIEGTVAGVAAAAAVAALASWGRLGIVDATLLSQMTVAAIAGSYLESVAGSWNRKKRNPVPNGALNLFNTLVGAGVFLLLAHR